jgi:NAD(P)H-dependent flavin oxidoreductase YrpB (nitropropane dioxygenase family)
MTIWPDHRLLDLLGIELPIILAPMAGSGTAALAIAVAEAGGLGSLACALLSPDQARVEFAHSTRDVEAHQHEFLLPCDSDDRCGSRGRLAAAAEALFCRARSRS